MRQRSYVLRGLSAMLLATAVLHCSSDDTDGSGSSDASPVDASDASRTDSVVEASKPDATIDAGLDAPANADTSYEGSAGEAGAEAGDAQVDATVDAPSAVDGGDARVSKKKVIIFVWDGLRPDSVNPTNTPHLAALRDQSGVNFTKNHSVFPTFTMMNASAFATGAYPGTHGFYGNTEYQPGPAGNGATGVPANFAQPIFTEDYGVLQALDTYYKSQNSSLFLVETLFQTAHTQGLKTAAVGKSGPAFIQDYREDGSGGVILDENIAFPLSFAQALQTANIALPKNTTHYPYPGDAGILLGADAGDPTATVGSNLVFLADGVTSDPRSLKPSPHDSKNEYMMGVYINYILPQVDPDLSLIWFRNPDSTEHTYGPGSPPYLDALHDQDTLLGQLQAKLSDLGLAQSTDIIVVSDHGHSTVAGDPAVFPLRAFVGNADGTATVGAADPAGYAVSGDIRSADLLTKAGIPDVFDGNGCMYDPVISGIKSDGSQVYPTLTDTAGTVCGTANKKYSTPNYTLPATLPADAVVIAANGGSDYLYVPNHDTALVQTVVSALQKRAGYGAIFVRSAYGAIPGTLPLTAIQVEGATRGSPPTPDVIVSFDWSETAVSAGSQGLPGTEYESAQNNRGMHGSFSPIDVHNTLIAAGPDFKQAFSDTYPTGNVDVAPTVASLFNFSLPHANGRVLKEALVGQTVNYTVTTTSVESTSVALSGVCSVADPTCAVPGAAASYKSTLTQSTLTAEGTQFTYYDQAKATRQ